MMETTLINKVKSRIMNASDFSQIFMRLAIALVMWPHGAQLLMGLFNGYGFSNSMGYFTQEAGLPWIIAFLVILIQFFSPLFLLLGLGIRYNALLMIVLVVGMIFSGHVEHGFFMNWMGNQKGEGFEFHLLLIGLSLSLLFVKEYKYSIDNYISKLYKLEFNGIVECD